MRAGSGISITRGPVALAACFDTLDSFPVATVGAEVTLAALGAASAVKSRSRPAMMPAASTNVRMIDRVNAVR